MTKSYFYIFNGMYFLQSNWIYRIFSFLPNFFNRSIMESFPKNKVGKISFITTLLANKLVILHLALHETLSLCLYNI